MSLISKAVQSAGVLLFESMQISQTDLLAKPCTLVKSRDTNWSVRYAVATSIRHLRLNDHVSRILATLLVGG
jgi:hypothetical protein